MNKIKPFALSPSKGEHPKGHSWFDRLTTNGFRQRGFTLIEVLVALFILAITMAAVSRTASSSIHHVEALRTRVIANWVAQNRLALHQARCDWLPPGIQTGSEEQAGQSYPWQEEVIATPNPTMRRIIVNVYAPGEGKHSLRELTGYLVKEPR
jgi:general secretion pathway protein I